MSRRFWTEDRIITEIQKCHSQGEDLWYRAMERNHKDLIRASERYFRGWKNAVEAAGLDYGSIKKRSHQVWTEDKILQRLYDLNNQNIKLKASNIQKIDKKLYHASIRQFGNFNNALSKFKERFKLEPVTKTAEKPKEGFKIFTVKTRIRSERNVGEAIIKRAEVKGVAIGTIHYPSILNGYLFVECENREKLTKLIRNIKNAQGLLNGETTQDEINKYINTPKVKKHISEGSHIEITDGKFKGERAIIQHINDRTKNLTVELVDEIMKIPIIIHRDKCKIVH